MQRRSPSMSAAHVYVRSKHASDLSADKSLLVPAEKLSVFCMTNRQRQCVLRVWSSFFVAIRSSWSRPPTCSKILFEWKEKEAEREQGGEEPETRCFSTAAIYLWSTQMLLYWTIRGMSCPRQSRHCSSVSGARDPFRNGDSQLF